MLTQMRPMNARYHLCHDLAKSNSPKNVTRLVSGSLCPTKWLNSNHGAAVQCIEVSEVAERVFRLLGGPQIQPQGQSHLESP